MHKALHVPEGLDITGPSLARIYNDPLVELHSHAIIATGGAVSAILGDVRGAVARIP
jgi:hypothetical protein